MPKKKAFVLLGPSLPESFETVDAFDEQMRLRLSEHDEIEAVRFCGAHIDALYARHAVFRGCVFEKCVFSQQDDLPVRFDFMDCVFTGCDFASARFEKASLARCALTSCRLTGAAFTGALLRHVTMDECQLTYSGFGEAKLTGVDMTGCDLSFASFGYAKLENVRWERCKMAGAELFGVLLKGMDLRTNELDGIVVSAGFAELCGAVVTAEQACGLAKLLGVVIA